MPSNTTKAPTIAVLGQGIAGTLVSMRLRERGVAHVVIDRGHDRSSSRAAAGLVNPVTGRRFVLVDGFDGYVARFGIYDRLATLLGRRYVSPLTIYRDLSRVKDRNQWDLRRATAAYAPYLAAPIQVADLWLGPTHGAYRVDLPGLIADYRSLLRREGTLAARAIDAEVVQLPNGQLQVTKGVYDIVIDCRGAACAKTAVWRDRPWRLSKGESVRFAYPDWPWDAATKLSGCFLAPIGDGDDLWYGGTSTDRYDDEATTGEFQTRFLGDVERLLGGSASLRGHLPTTAIGAATGTAAPYGPAVDTGAPHSGPRHLERYRYAAAIRPTTNDRQPLVGPHDRLTGFYICNGLGTKGALTAPSVSAELWSMLAPVLQR